MCLSRSGVRSISGFRRALRMNGATALTSCTSSSSTDGTSASSRRQELRPRRSTCCRSWSSRPSGNRCCCAEQFLGQQRHLRQLRARASRPAASAMPRAPAAWRRRARHRGSRCRSRAGLRTRPAACARARAGRQRRARLAVHHVRVELRRTAHGLAGVVDDEVEPRRASASSWRQNASTLGVWRRSRPKISSRSPHSAKSGSARVARRRVAREARGHDQLRAGAQQLDAGLVADLHPAAGEQRDAAAQVGRSRCACGS